MFSKDFYLVIVAIVLISAGVFWLANSWILPAHSREATLYLAFENDGKGRMFSGEVVDGMTILDAVIASSEAGRIKFLYHIDKDGKLVVDGIDGYTPAVSGKEVLFRLNGAKIATDYIGKTRIKAGDRIEVYLE